jgi:hypothetical protein
LAWYKLHARISKQCTVASILKPNEHFNKKLSEKMMDSGRNDGVKVPAALESDSQSKINESLNSNSNKTKEIPKHTPSVIMPLNFFKFENANTVTSLVGQLKDNQNKKLLTGLSCSTNEPEDSFLTDLVF